MKLTDFIGQHVAKLLKTKPFDQWQLETSIEDGLEQRIIHYIFDNNGLELRCDSKEYIDVIFLSSEKHGGFDDSLIELSFSMSRKQVCNVLGSPSQSGQKINDPILGEYGAWDKFTDMKLATHIEYKISEDSIRRITFMRLDAMS